MARPSRFRPTLALIVLAPIVGSGLLALQLARSANDQRLNEPKPTATFGRAQTATAIALDVAAALEWTTVEPTGLSWPGLVGTVTAVFVEPGDRLSSGAPVAEVNGFTVIALHTDTPLYRPISASVVGPDRDTIEGFLRFVLGEPSMAFGRLVNLYLERNGSTVRDGVFRPEYVVWLPTESLTVGRVTGLGTGFAAPNPSTAFIYPPASIESPTLMTADNTGPLVVELVDPFEAVISIGASETLPGTADPDGVVGIDADADLSALSERTTPLAVSVEVTRPGDYLLVPSGAIIIDGSTVCVATSSTTTEDISTINVTTVWTSDGVVFLERQDSLELEGKALLLNPIDVGVDACVP